MTSHSLYLSYLSEHTRQNVSGSGILACLKDVDVVEDKDLNGCNRSQFHIESEVCEYLRYLRGTNISANYSLSLQGKFDCPCIGTVVT